MKNAIRTTVYNVLTGKAPVSEEEKLAAIRAIEDEMAKEQEAKAGKNDAYAAAWEAVYEVLVKTKSPLTVAEIAERADLPDGFSRGQVQYGMTFTWRDNVVKIDGKPCTYRLK